ncbi:MAG: indolepyruvate ferredoxin oxidoreductase family protein [Gammaproteobacteria bacterium]|nr:indolepyruvate ferredoxin oxidoreductase family protein [Gammaproteobacteria bacterium]
MGQITLVDKYEVVTGRVYLTGTQALVRLLMLQQLRDRSRGLNTAGFVSGYRGSPLGVLDRELWKARPYLAQHRITFIPGVNEELAATSVWGTQQVSLFPGAKYDGVYAMWYGKGPGVDRSTDVLRHGNAAGTSKHGGVLVIAGDDPGAKSSSLAHQSDHLFKAILMPVLAPASVQEYLDYGLHGWALSRYSGCWVALKAVTDTVESSASVYVDPHRVQIVTPSGPIVPTDGLSIRWPDPPLAQERRLLNHKLYAALAYCRANALNQTVIDSPKPRLGIITAGKSYLDVRQALDDLGIDERRAVEIGLRVYKVGMVWPLESEGVHRFAEGLEEILVVEEKRQLLEYQLKEQLYNWREDVRPRVIGKFDEKGEWVLPHDHWLLPAAGELTPAMIARVIASRIERFHTSSKMHERLTLIDAKEKALAEPHLTVARVAHYCSGCPHSSSTKTPEGSRVLAGIGCHYMALWLDPVTTQTFSQMGGEGVAWIGQAPFTHTKHVFANLGDGTYFHSGILAIRAAVAAKVPITYKLLYNDAVAMTGGQPLDGVLTVPQITHQLTGEGVKKIVVVTDEPEKYGDAAGFAKDVPIRHRNDLDAIQRELREYPGVSVIVYDQTCAAEKRRRRKRGTYPDPPKRAFINEAVCEGCGDCSNKSNCMSVVPLETEFGRKREIDQSSCNKDFSCVNGFCPSFVTVEGGSVRKGVALADADRSEWNIPEPILPSLDEPYGILVTGIGGTGVVTIGALLGMAAHIEQKGVTALDMAGIAQKGGAVWSHVRIAARSEQLYAPRIATGEANVVLGCDIVVTIADETLAKVRAGWTRAVINTDFSITSDFIRAFSAQAKTGDLERHPDPIFPLDGMKARVDETIGLGRTHFVDATRLATALIGNTIATNLFLLGYAYQKGLIPISAAAILQAIELNATAVDTSKKSFLWGRRAAHDLDLVKKIATPIDPAHAHLTPSRDLNELISRRAVHLTEYQDAAYARRYTDLVERIRSVESSKGGDDTRLTEAVARYYFKLLAYKDEYEVARLYTNGDFLKRLHATFDGDFRLTFHLAPPAFAKADPITGESRKRSFGPWMLGVFEVLAKFKFLRGTVFDIFRYSEDRKIERQLIVDYERNIEKLIARLSPQNYECAIEIASLPERVRGFGSVKKRHLEHAKKREMELLAAFNSGSRKERLPELVNAR